MSTSGVGLGGRYFGGIFEVLGFEFMVFIVLGFFILSTWSVLNG